MQESGSQVTSDVETIVETMERSCQWMERKDDKGGTVEIAMFASHKFG